MEKLLGWACKLGGAESLGISKVGQTVLATLMKSQLQHQIAGTVEEGFKKGTMTSACLGARHFSFSLCHWCLSSCYPGAGTLREWVWVGEFMCGFFENCLEFQQFLALMQFPLVLQSEVVGTYLPDIGILGWRCWCGARTLRSWDIPPEFLSTTHGYRTSLFCDCAPPTSLMDVVSLIP